MEPDYFLDSLNSKRTKELYSFHLQRFRDWCLHHANEDSQKQVIGYLMEMKRGGLSYAYRSNAVSAIRHYYEMNDILLNWKKISRFLGEVTLDYEIRGYTHEEITRLLSFSNVKHRALILTLASTGMRREALAQLKTSNIEYLEQYQLYKIKIYRKTQSEQICFTTPEAAKEIQQYLKIRDSLRLDNSLFQYDNSVSVSVVLRKLVIKAKVGNVHHEAEGDRHGQFRDSIPAAHGLRKFCITQMARAKVDTEVAKLLTGHSIGVRSRYLNYTDEDLLQEYSKAIDYLTINEENRLRKKVEVLKAKRDEIEMLKGQVQQKDDRLSVIEKQMQSLVSTLSKLTEQGQVNAVAQTLYSSGILKEGKEATIQ